MSLWKKLAIQIVPVIITIIVSITGAYVALNSQVSGLAAEVQRLTKVVDLLVTEGQLNRDIAKEVATLIKSVDGLLARTVPMAVKEAVIEHNSARINELSVVLAQVMAGYGDLRVSVKVLERDTENLRRELKAVQR